MTSERKQKKKSARLRGILIFELIVSYIAVLNIISHFRGPQQYMAAQSIPLLVASDFMPFGEGVAQESDTLYISNETQGVPTGHWANLPLTKLDRIIFNFRLECPQECAGGILCVDLYNYECGYDDENQEFRLTLQEGVNDVSAWIDVSESAPDKAQLRIFTVDVADYEVAALEILQALPVPKVTGGMVAVAIVCFLLLGGTLILYWKTINPRNAR